MTHSDVNIQINPDRHRIFIGGEPFELWENPDFPFHGDRDELDGFRERGQWELLFNALVLTAEAPESFIS
jgi:hypothetical protein